MKRAGLALVLVLLASSRLTSAGTEEPERRRVVAGERYRAGWVHRFLFGRDYRELWTTPITLPVLDLEAFAGGATPVRRLGHGQSKALALRGADGRAYTFRPVLKDPTGLLPVELRETFVRDFLQDQMASGHPAGHVVVPPLMAAAGVLHNEPRLVILEDHPVLGEFRADFGGQVGDIEEWGGSPGFAGAVENVDGEEMWKRLRADPGMRVDSRAFLAARLMDHLIGDWDRHRNQWRWARVPGKDRWQPIPEDRDQAFVKFEGFALSFVRPTLPLLVRFGPRHSSLDGLTFDSWDVDRRLLADLPRSAFLEVGADLRARLTDAVIGEAARRLPPEYYEKDGPRLAAALERRRDRLVEHAERFYRYLSREVDVHGTDAPEVAEVLRTGDGGLELSLARVPEAGGETVPYFRRRFDPRETKEVRLLLFGGDDRVVVRGRRRGGVLLRVVGGAGDDRLDDSAGGGTRFSDDGGDDQVLAGPDTSWDRKPYVAPPNRSADWIPPRDWGRRTLPLFRVTGGPDLGVLLSAAVVTTGYGFRKDPWADHQRLRIAYATAARAFRAQYDGEFGFENSRWRTALHARASGFEILRFHGFGNETAIAGPADRYQVEQEQYWLAPSLVFSPASGVDVSLGPVVKYVKTDPRDNPVLGPRVDDFGQLGLRLRLDVDTTDRPGLPSRGLRLSAAGGYQPAVWNAERGFGDVQGEVVAFLSARAPLDPTLVLKAGGQAVLGSYPFHEAAFLGGGSVLAAGPIGGGNTAVRGLVSQRYAGDSALYGSAELRLALTRAFLLVPAEIGLFGLADAGRVWLEGERSDRWHTGVGGGVFLASPGRRNAVSIAVARSEGRTAVYVRAGLAF
jgi:hypothetical protein